MRPAPAFDGWRMVRVAFLVDFIAVGFFFYSFGVYYPAIDAEFEGGSFEVAIGISISNLVSGVFAPWIGRWLDRASLRKVMTLGALIVSTGFLLLSFTHTLWQYYLVLGTLFAFGLGMMGGMASGKLVANWFSARRGTALGIATMGVSLSGMVMPAVATWLIDSFGWRAGFQVYAAGILLLVVPLVSLLVVTRPEDVGQHPDGDTPDPSAPPNPLDVWWSRSDVLRNRNFWVIALPFAMSFASLSAVLIHLKPHAADLGIEGYRAVHALSLAAGAGVLGKVVFARMVDRSDPRVAAWASFGTQILGLLMIMHAGGYAALAFGGLIYGFGMGGVVPLQGAITGRVFGRLSFGEVMGLMRPVQVPLNLVGVPLAAWLHDATGSFQLAFGVFVGVYVLSAGLIGLLRVPPGGPVPVASADEPGLV